MRTAIVDDVYRRLEARQATRSEVKLREARLRQAARLLAEIAASPGGTPQPGAAGARLG